MHIPSGPVLTREQTMAVTVDFNRIMMVHIQSEAHYQSRSKKVRADGKSM